MAGKGGGAWKVAYADFVTAMMAFFMVMWLTSQSPEVRHAVAEHFRNPSGKRLNGTESRSVVPNDSKGTGSRRVVKTQGSRRNDEQSKERQMTDEGNRSNVGKIITFGLNSLELSSEGKAELNLLLPELEGPQYRIEVRGHSANNGADATRSAMDAWTISFKRAMAVTQYLIEKGVDPRRIRPSAAGHSDPRIHDGVQDKKSDSRVEVFVLKELFEEPASRANRQASAKQLDAEADRLASEEESQQQSVTASAH